MRSPGSAESIGLAAYRAINKFIGLNYYYYSILLGCFPLSYATSPAFYGEPHARAPARARRKAPIDGQSASGGRQGHDG